MGIPKHNFPAASKITSEIIHAAVNPELRPSSHSGSHPKSGRVSDKGNLVDSQPPRSPGIKTTPTSIATFGESLPGLLVETVLDPNCPNQLALLIQNSKGAEIRKCIQYRGIDYRPQTIDTGLAMAVRFSSGFSPISTTADLVSDIEKVLSKYIDVDTQTVKVLTCFIFATWFIDCFQVAPLLWVHGPEHEVGIVMRLLNCVCYHPTLLSDLDLTALRTLPAGLRVTLLVKQTELAPRVERALLNSGRRPFHLAIGKQPLDIFGARALHCESSNSQLGLSVFINPAQKALPTLPDREERVIADRFQSKLMAYRLSHHQQAQEFEAPESANQHGSADEMKTWLAAIGECPDLDQSIRHTFAERRAELSSVHYEDPKCLVIEAAFLFCHRKEAKHFFVRELTEKVNDLLLGRYADFELEDRKVGSVLSDLGIGRRRVTKGFRVDVTSKMRMRIHRIALAYNVLSFQAGVTHCAECGTTIKSSS